VSLGDGRHGRRDNGLTATEYAAAGDVDPRVGEHLLDVLALHGIAAYLRPSSDTNPVTRTNVLPGRPTDRLYVDRLHLATARDYIARLDVGGPHAAPAQAAAPPAAESTGGEPNIDEAWAKIVEEFDRDSTGPRRAWPEAEDLAEPRPGAGGGLRGRLVYGTPPTRPTSAEEPSLLDGLDTFGAGLPDPEDEDYTPPPAPPVPRPSAATLLAVVGIVGGLIVFLRPSLLPTSPGLAMFAGFTALLGGFAALVWRLRPGDDDDVDPDDGARV
jgi:hypothetical protein